MMTTAFAALCLLARLQGGSSHWPIVPGALFSLNGADSPVSHAMIAVKGDSTGKLASGDSGSGFVGLPRGATPWKTLQIAFTYTADGTLARFGGISLVTKGGHLYYSKDGAMIEVAPLTQGESNDVQILKHYDSIHAYVNGERASRSILPTKPLLPIEVGLDTWKGKILGIAGYSRELSVDELFANEHSLLSPTKSSPAVDATPKTEPPGPDTAKVTVEGELTAMTPVPDIDRIRPYRSALLAEEYKVVKIVSGRMASIKPGMKIRIYRYGIRAGEKTDIKDMKIGDHAEMLIQPYDSDPKFAREFQVDALDPDITIPLFVDVTPAK